MLRAQMFCGKRKSSFDTSSQEKTRSLIGHETVMNTQLEPVEKTVQCTNTWFLILQFACVDTQTCERLARANKRTRALTDDNRIWWPLFKRLWMHLHMHFERRDDLQGDNDPFWFTKQVMSQIDENPNLFSTKRNVDKSDTKQGKKTKLLTWQSQYKILQSTLVPRLIWVDIEDGRAFMPTAGWFRYHRQLFVDYWNIPANDQHAWIEQLVTRCETIVCSDDVSQDEDRRHNIIKRSDMRAQMERIVEHHKEWYRRLQQKRTFCLHWTSMAETEWENPQALDEFLWGLREQRHDNLSAWNRPHSSQNHALCTQRCGVFLPAERKDRLPSPTVEYQVMTSTQCQWSSTFFLFDFASNYFAGAFGLEHSLRTSAGYCDYDPTQSRSLEDQDSYLAYAFSSFGVDPKIHGPCHSIEGDDKHFQIFRLGICGKPPHIARRMICRQLFPSAMCALQCVDVKKDVYYNSQDKDPPGCGVYLGPAVERNHPMFDCKKHICIETYETDYCPSCVKKLEAEARTQKCLRCQSEKTLDLRCLLTDDELLATRPIK